MAESCAALKTSKDIGSGSVGGDDGAQMKLKASKQVTKRISSSWKQGYSHGLSTRNQQPRKNQKEEHEQEQRSSISS
ncbi:GH11405 [Drosophila grimshawi]|uniref:GH11405 n=1 Tax=Drosophila grimshawi TaxID=7222 RepID=B4JA75_DROGR|nr:GH11405 [Drosophila grimshawi]